MIIKQFIIVICGLTIITCGQKSNGSKPSDQISGAYAREYSFVVTNPESGKEIGRSTIRDTIFLEPIENGYKVSNRRWRLNDYDKAGWWNMEHSDDRPLSSYVGQFSDKDLALHSVPPNLSPPIYVDLSKQAIFKTKAQQQPYRKTK